MMYSKTDIRKLVKGRIKSMTAVQRHSESENLLRQLEQHSMFVRARVVLMFCSLPDEVCTHHFIEKWSNKKTILLPVVQDKNLDLRKFVSFHAMESSDFHIDVPQGPSYLDFSRIDLIVVPGLAFTAQGFRLGRGGGYYDRFLSRSEVQQIPKIGICYPCQLFSQLPVESHDVPMDDVICSLSMSLSVIDKF